MQQSNENQSVTLAPALDSSAMAEKSSAIGAFLKKLFPHRKPSLERSKARAGWVFVLPFVIGLIFIYAPVLINSIAYSFGKLTIDRVTGNMVLNPVGFANYAEALTSNKEFTQVLVGGITQLIIDIPAIVIFSLFVAVILNQKMFGRAAFRAIFFVPVIISTGLIDAIDTGNSLLNHMGGGSMDDGSGSSSASQIVDAVDIERLFAGMAVGQELVQYVTGLVNDIYNIVNRSGVQILIFLAGLQSISPSIYEACRIDGATAWETFWKITFPMISPMILVNALYTTIDSFTSASNTVMTFIDGIFTNAKNELATAMAWIYFIIIMLIIGLVFSIFSAFVFYQKRDA